MNILILVATITWSFGGGYQNTPSFIMVDSPERAAICVYNDKPFPFEVEPDQKIYTLYDVDLEKKTIKEIPIPKLGFELPEKAK